MGPYDERRASEEKNERGLGRKERGVPRSPASAISPTRLFFACRCFRSLPPIESLEQATLSNDVKSTISLNFPK